MRFMQYLQFRLGGKKPFELNSEPMIDDSVVRSNDLLIDCLVD